VRQVLKFNFTSSKTRGLRNQSGQAVVEYVLVLIVTISIIFALKDVFSGVEKFMYSYIGEYTACLMEYGELPSAGISDGELKKHEGGGSGKVCDSKFAGFTFGTGRTPLSSGPGSGTGSSGSGSSSGSNGINSNSTSTDSSGKNSSKSASTSSKQLPDDKLNSNSNNSGSDSENSAYAKGRISRSSDIKRNGGTADGRSDSGADGRIKVISGGDSGGPSYDTDPSDGGRSGYDRSRYKAITGGLASQTDRRSQASTREAGGKVLKVIDESGRAGPRKSSVAPYERKPAADVPKDEGFTIGNFMKWLIIAAMFIAIILFFGGQVMSFMNSQEK
jgi:hypothetical protein